MDYFSDKPKRVTLKSLQKDLQLFKSSEQYFRNATGTANDLENAEKYKKWAEEKQLEIDEYARKKKP